MMDDVYNHRRSVISIPDNSDASRSLLAELDFRRRYLLPSGGRVCSSARRQQTTRTESRSHRLIASRCYMRRGGYCITDNRTNNRRTSDRSFSNQSFSSRSTPRTHKLQSFATPFCQTDVQVRNVNAYSSGLKRHTPKSLQRKNDSPSPIPPPSLLLDRFIHLRSLRRRRCFLGNVRGRDRCGMHSAQRIKLQIVCRRRPQSPR